MTTLYRCNDCGHEFEIPDTWEEYRGEFWGMPAYERVSGCPMCQSGDYDEVVDDPADEESEGEE